MLAKTKTAIAATFMLGIASAAQAEGADHDYAYGGPNQTWQDLEQSRKDIQLLIQKEYHTSTTGTPNNAYGYVVPSEQTRRAPREQTKNR